MRGLEPIPLAFSQLLGRLFSSPLNTVVYDMLKDFQENKPYPSDLCSSCCTFTKNKFYGRHTYGRRTLF